MRLSIATDVWTPHAIGVFRPLIPLEAPARGVPVAAIPAIGSREGIGVGALAHSGAARRARSRPSETGIPATA